MAGSQTDRRAGKTTKTFGWEATSVRQPFIPEMQTIYHLEGNAANSAAESKDYFQPP